MFFWKRLIPYARISRVVETDLHEFMARVFSHMYIFMSNRLRFPNITFPKNGLFSRIIWSSLVFPKLNIGSGSHEHVKNLKIEGFQVVLE